MVGDGIDHPLVGDGDRFAAGLGPNVLIGHTLPND
jgi:hypothetical protein